MKKKFKDLIRDNLEEWNSSGMIVPGYNMPGVSDHTMGGFNIENPEVLEQLNTFLQTKVNEKQWLHPSRALMMCRAKINLIGLDFPCYPQMMEQITDGTTVEYPVSQYGGRYGWSMEEGDVTSDDGITHRLGYPLSFTASYTKTPNGLYEIDVAVVPSMEEEVGESYTIDLSFLHEFVDRIPTDELLEDAIAGRELQIYIENDSTIYKRRLLPAYKNLITKMAREQYDPKKAEKLLMYTVNEAAKSYAKEYSNGENIFDKKTKEWVAEQLRTDFEAEAELGNYNNMLPKKYQ